MEGSLWIHCVRALEAELPEQQFNTWVRPLQVEESAGAIKLFEAAARRGRRELTIRGRYVVEVSFGDFPYVIRFTPRRR